jgi:hypothetical protein
VPACDPGAAGFELTNLKLDTAERLKRPARSGGITIRAGRQG